MLNFFAKALIKRQLKGKISESEMDKMLELIEKNPDFFTQMAASVETKMKTGMSQENAANEFMTESGEEAKKIIGGFGK